MTSKFSAVLLYFFGGLAFTYQYLKHLQRIKMHVIMRERL